MNRFGRRPRGPRWATLLLVAVVAALPILTACSGTASNPQVAKIDATSTANQPQSGSPSATQSALAYSQCMRAHGIADFPDPNANGQIELHSSPDTPDLAPDSAQFQAADKACHSLMPGSSPEQQQEDYRARLKFAQCMRDHGIKGMPDPQPPSSGSTTQQSGPGGTPQAPAIDPDTPQFQRAQQVCKRYLPSDDEGPSLDTLGDGK